jgi:hypothetical protein
MGEGRHRNSRRLTGASVWFDLARCLVHLRKDCPVPLRGYDAGSVDHDRENAPLSIPIGLFAEFTAEIEREFAELISGIQVAKMEAF